MHLSFLLLTLPAAEDPPAAVLWLLGSHGVNIRFITLYDDSPATRLLALCVETESLSASLELLRSHQAPLDIRSISHHPRVRILSVYPYKERAQGIFIETESGQTKVLTRGSNLPLHFSIAENEFFPNENNWISIETDAECGQTGYSNAVSHVYNPGGPCARGVTIFQTGGYQNLTSNTTIAGLSTCAAGTLYNYYFEREGSGGAVRLNTQPQPLLRFVLANQPTGTGYGRYWFAPVNPVTLVEGTASPAAVLDARNAPKTNATNGGTGPQPVPVNTQYVHWDHLGSTRMMTDEEGAVIARVTSEPVCWCRLVMPVRWRRHCVG